MKYAFRFAIFFLIVLFISCQQQRHAEWKDAAEGSPLATADSLSAPAISDTFRLFVKTADLRFRVNEVLESTRQMEQLVSREGGFLIQSNLQSSVEQVTQTPVSPDSMLERTYYTVSNEIRFRIPNARFDTVMQQLTASQQFLDSRRISFDDVSLQYWRNNDAQARLTESVSRNRNVSLHKARQANQAVYVDEVTLNRQQERDEARLQNKHLQDQVAFSTVSVYIYQSPLEKRTLIPMFKTIAPYEPGFWLKAQSSLSDGWKLLSGLFLLLLRGWTLLFLLLLGWWVYRRHQTGSSKRKLQLH
jgi:hypothetical protein